MFIIVLIDWSIYIFLLKTYYKNGVPHIFRGIDYLFHERGNLIFLLFEGAITSFLKDVSKGLYVF